MFGKSYEIPNIFIIFTIDIQTTLLNVNFQTHREKD